MVLLLGSYNTVSVSWCTPGYTFWSGISQIPDVLELLNFSSVHLKVGLENSFLIPTPHLRRFAAFWFISFAHTCLSVPEFYKCPRYVIWLPRSSFSSVLQNKSQTVRTAVQNWQPCDRWCGRREHGLRVCLDHSTARDLEPGSAPGWVPRASVSRAFLQTAHLSCCRHCLWSLQCLAGFCIFSCPTQGFQLSENKQAALTPTPHTRSFLDKCSNCVEVTWSFFLFRF